MCVYIHTQWVPGYSRGVKRPRRRVNHLPHLTPKLKSRAEPQLPIVPSWLVIGEISHIYIYIYIVVSCLLLYYSFRIFRHILVAVYILAMDASLAT
jgi:hypothetical protein